MWFDGTTLMYVLDCASAMIAPGTRSFRSPAILQPPPPPPPPQPAWQHMHASLVKSRVARSSWHAAGLAAGRSVSPLQASTTVLSQAAAPSMHSTCPACTAAPGMHSTRPPPTLHPPPHQHRTFMHASPHRSMRPQHTSRILASSHPPCRLRARAVRALRHAIAARTAGC